MAMTLDGDMKRKVYEEYLHLYDGDKDKALQDLGTFYLGWLAIAPHLTQPAQAVDVGVIREVIATLEADGDEHGVADKLTRALAGEKAEGWRDISTAPKDGTRIMLSNGHGVWMAEFHAAYPSGYRPMSPWFSVMLNHGHIPQAKRHHAPTHWQPLPTPPTDGEE